MLKMFNFLNSKKADELIIKIQLIENDIKQIKQDIEKIDIKAMEAQRSYRAKLARLTGERESEKNIKDSVFLSPDGALL